MNKHIRNNEKKKEEGREGQTLRTVLRVMFCDWMALSISCLAPDE